MAPEALHTIISYPEARAMAAQERAVALADIWKRLRTRFGEALRPLQRPVGRMG